MPRKRKAEAVTGIKYYKLFDLMRSRGIMKNTALLKEEYGGLSRPTLSKLERGETVRTDIIYKICVALHVQPGDIMEIPENEYLSVQASEQSE